MLRGAVVDAPAVKVVDVIWGALGSVAVGALLAIIRGTSSLPDLGRPGLRRFTTGGSSEIVPSRVRPWMMESSWLGAVTVGVTTAASGRVATSNNGGSVLGSSDKIFTPSGRPFDWSLESFFAAGTDCSGTIWPQLIQKC